MRVIGWFLNLPGVRSDSGPDYLKAWTREWFQLNMPENKDPAHGWDESNINILTDNAYETCDPAMGATHVRTLLCKIYPEDQDGGS